MPPTIKLFSIALVAWSVFGTTTTTSAASLVVLAGLLLLLAVLDAAQVLPRGTGRDTPPTDADLGALLRRLCGLAVGPFYVALLALACAAILARIWASPMSMTEMRTAAEPSRLSLCGGECGSGAGCGSGGCGASSGGACGCGGGIGKSSAAAKPKPKPPVTAEEAKARTTALQKRGQTTPAANLPGIGPNAKPLPPGLTPKANVELPPAAQKLLEAQKIATPTPAPAPSALTKTLPTSPQIPTPSLSPASAPAPVAPSPAIPQPQSQAR